MGRSNPTQRPDIDGKRPGGVDHHAGIDPPPVGRYAQTPLSSVSMPVARVRT
jgi:hypothetical protein